MQTASPLPFSFESSPLGLIPCARYPMQYNNMRHMVVDCENAFSDMKL